MSGSVEPNLSLELWSRAGDVVIVRQALAGLAELLSLDASGAADLATVATEACNNVVVHAYAPDGSGPMNVEVAFASTQLVITVSDLGHGMTARAKEPGEAGGLGLPMMAALSSSLEIGANPGGGTRVSATFEIPAIDPDLVIGQTLWTKRPALAEDYLASGGAILTAAPGAVAAVTLARVARVLAGRARFTADGLEDVDRVSRRIADEVASERPNRALTCAILVAERELELRTFARLESVERAERDVEVFNEAGYTRTTLAVR